MRISTMIPADLRIGALIVYFVSGSPIAFHTLEGPVTAVIPSTPREAETLGHFSVHREIRRPDFTRTLYARIAEELREIERIHA